MDACGQTSGFIERSPISFTEDGLFRFAPPENFSACTAVTLGDARDDSVSGHRKIITKLHVNWGHASARQLKRVLVNYHSANYHSENYHR